MRRFELRDFSNAKQFLDENGFVIFSDVFDPRDLDDFKNEFAEIVRAYVSKAGLRALDNDDGALDLNLFALENRDHSYVAEIYDAAAQCPSFLRVISGQSLTNTVRSLLGRRDTPLYTFTNRCRIDPPLDARRTYGWHQEVFYTIPRGKFLQTWAPLIRDTTIENGTIEVAVGSHRKGIVRQTWNDVEGRATQIIVDDEVIRECESLPIEMKVGELLIFSGFLAHRSGSNSSQHHRFSLVGMYHDVAHSGFETPRLNYEFRGLDPRRFFDAEMARIPES